MGSNPIELTKVFPFLPAFFLDSQVTVINPESPCTRVCILDAQTGWCLGCGRTGGEIGTWSSMSDAERVALKALLPARLLVIAGQSGFMPLLVPMGS